MLDRYVKIGAVTMPRWIAGRDALDGVLDVRAPDGRCDGYLVHLSEPRFVCRWTVAEEGAPLAPLVYSHDLEGETLELYDFVWTDDPPDDAGFRALMAAAVEALDNFIMQLDGAFE
jgi:hypothetical protein